MTSHPLTESVYQALATVIDPEIHRPITELGMVDSVEIDADNVAHVTVLLTIPGCPMSNTIRTDVAEAVAGVAGITGVDVTMGAMNDEQRAALTQQLRGGAPQTFIPFAQPENRTRVIAIASGKGGVGKSSLTVNLAMALSTIGKSVGVLDADIYGHSIPDMLGLGQARPTGIDDKIVPVPMMGIKVISIGMLKQSPDQVIAWRGPILDRALTQLLGDVLWGDLDFLLIDMPPGTGDIAMGLGQKLPNSEVIVVTTPQQAAIEVAERAGTMAGMMEQRVIGVIENMSYLEATCPHCSESHRVELFGAGGGEKVAQELSDRLGYQVDLLAQIPIDQLLRENGDSGMPLVVTNPERPAAQAVKQAAQVLAARQKSLLGVPLGVKPV